MKEGLNLLSESSHTPKSKEADALANSSLSQDDMDKDGSQYKSRHTRKSKEADALVNSSLFQDDMDKDGSQDQSRHTPKSKEADASGTSCYQIS